MVFLFFLHQLQHQYRSVSSSCTSSCLRIRVVFFSTVNSLKKIPAWGRVESLSSSPRIISRQLKIRALTHNRELSMPDLTFTSRSFSVRTLKKISFSDNLQSGAYKNEPCNIRTAKDSALRKPCFSFLPRPYRTLFLLLLSGHILYPSAPLLAPPFLTSDIPRY